MFVIKHKKIFLAISAALVILSIVAIASWGLRLAIDFTGGSILEVTYEGELPAVEEVDEALGALELEGSSNARPFGESGYLIRTPFLEDAEREDVVQALTLGGEREVTLDRFSSVGPSIGSELKQKALIAIAVVVVAIILFIAFAFRKVSEPVSSWKYGFVAIITLLHDIIIPTGVFAFLSTRGAEVDLLFVMALLAILGYSVNDTIVVFDRVRENLHVNQETHKKEEFGDTVGKSLNQTFSRSLNTSLTTLLVLVALFIFGSSSTHFFALTLMVGIAAGTYSSIFLASPLLVVLNNLKKKE